VRIVHATDFYLPRLGGIEVQVSQLAGRQAEAGHAVSVLTSTRPSAAEAEVAAEAVEAEGATDRVGPVVRRLTGWSGRPGLRAAGGQVLDATAVLHAHLGGWSPFAFTAIAARARAGLPTVVTVHSVLDDLLLVHRTIGLVSSWRGAPIVWHGVSGPVVRQLRQVLGASADVRTVPNGVDRNFWAPPPVPAEPAHEVVVVAAMRHVRRKRVQALPAVLATAQAALSSAGGTAPPPLRAVVAGEGRCTPALRRALAQRGLSGWVQLPGRLSQEELRALYHQADVFVAPTILESFGLAALEARAAGLAVVARAESGTAELIRDGVEGLLVSSDVTMGQAIARLVLDADLRTRIRWHNARTAPATGWPQVLQLTEQSYHAALALARSPRPARATPAPATGGG